MTRSFHYTLMTRLDDARKAGGSLTMAHRTIREALRRANMKGKQFADVDDLIAFVATYSRYDPAAIRNAA